MIAVTTAITESGLRNYTVAVDHDSLGLFQQRPSMGWGRPQQLLDPGFATDAFLDKLIRTHPAHGWMAGDIGAISQRVQVSRYPAAYGPEVSDARLIVAQLWTRSDAAGPAVEQTSRRKAAAEKPSGPFSRSLLDAALGLPGTFDDRHQLSLSDWDGDGHADLVVVQQFGTLSGGTEVQILSGATNFLHLLLQTVVPSLGPTDARHTFSMADWNSDGRPDLVVIQKSGTASGRTEVRVLDGASYLQRYLQETATALSQSDSCRAFSVVDWNADARPDVVAIQTCGTASGRTEVRVLDGASGLQSYLQETVTSLGSADANDAFSVADWNGDLHVDLVLMRKSGTAGNRTVLRVLNGASTFQSFLVKESAAHIPTDDRHSLAVADWNRDGRLDLVVIQKSGTTSGRVGAKILAG